MNMIDVYKGAFGIYHIYQIKYMINENNKLNNYKINELKINYDLKLNELTKRIDRIDNKKWKIFKFIIFIIYNYFIL